MYNVGELILYGETGVCRVTGIVSKAFQDKEGEVLYYVLKPLHQSCTISVPVNSTKIFMRPIISRQEAESLIDMIPTIDAEVYHNKALRQLAEHYEDEIKSHSCEKLIRLTMSIYAKKQLSIKEKRKFGTTDERFMKRAEELLFGELGAALNIGINEVPAYIQSRVGEIPGDPAKPQIC